MYLRNFFNIDIIRTRIISISKIPYYADLSKFNYNLKQNFVQLFFWMLSVTDREIRDKSSKALTAFLLFGNIAERNCGATEKSAQLVNNGKILLVTAVIFDIVVTLYMIFNAEASVGHFNYKLPLLMQVIIFFSCYMPAILYIIGAKRNLPREYVLNERGRIKKMGSRRNQ